MRLSHPFASALLLLLASCGSHNLATTTPVDAAAAVSPICAAAREARSKAAELAKGGHELLALAKIDEANAACATERVATQPLEAKLLASTGQCARVRAMGAAAGKEPTATCAALEAPSAGDAASMRAKMHEAYGAERAKDYARAKGLYLEAWAQQHPNARALEDAARMAAAAKDAPEAQRLRDRALVEAEASEKATAILTSRVRVVNGTPRMWGDELWLGREGKVVARDLATGEVRVMLDVKGALTLSRQGSLAFVGPSEGGGDAISVYDVLTGALLYKLKGVNALATSPDDSLVAVMAPFDGSATASGGHVHVYDALTGEVRASLTGAWQQPGQVLLAFAQDANHLVLFGDADELVYREWDLDKKAFVAGVRLPSRAGLLATNGRFLTYVEGAGNDEMAPLHVRDMVEGKDVAQWRGRFVTLEAVAISPDGKTVATGSRNSLRLWDVHEHKQLFKNETFGEWNTSTNSRDPNAFAFSDDGKVMVLAGNGPTRAWDVATGVEKPLVGAQPMKKVLRVVNGPHAVAVVLEDEVRVVSESGEPQTVCKGTQPLYAAMIGPTNAAFSASGKSFACSMVNGVIHVYDATTWAERGVAKKAARGSIEHPIDLAFSADDKTVTAVSDANLAVYDAQTVAEVSKTVLKHPKQGLAPRHTRFDDGTIAVRLWNGSAAIFGADGAWQRDVKLVAGAPMDAPDAFSANGKTYAVALGKTLRIADLDNAANADEPRTVTLPAAAKSVAVSADGKSVVVVGKDGAVSIVGAGETQVHGVPHEGAASRAWFNKASVVIVSGTDTLEAHPLAAGSAVTALEIDPDGLVARDASGGFEVRGKPELECIVGKTSLGRLTCADRAKEGVVAAWLRASGN